MGRAWVMRGHRGRGMGKKALPFLEKEQVLGHTVAEHAWHALSMPGWRWLDGGIIGGLGLAVGVAVGSARGSAVHRHGQAVGTYHLIAQPRRHHPGPPTPPCTPPKKGWKGNQGVLCQPPRPAPLPLTVQCNLLFAWQRIPAPSRPPCCRSARRPALCSPRYRHRFSMGASGGGAINNLFHSFNVGGAHFAAFSSEHDYSATAEQVPRLGTHLNCRSKRGGG